jgi:biotin operon repressor
METEMTTRSNLAKSGAKQRTTKKAKLIRMLSTKAGADVDLIGSKLGWQSHTTRAAITGLKKAGYAVSAEKESGKPTRYRIAAEPRTNTDADSQAATENEATPDPANAR